MTTLRPLLLIFLATLCPLLAGCLVPVGWAYPTVSIVPPAALDSTDQVRAFRVDVADQLSEIDMNGGDDYVLSEVPIPEHGILLPQTKVALDYGYVWNMIAIVYGGHTHHTALLRLYRPGFQTVEISSWEIPRRVKWQKAEDLTAQERAVDDLLATWKTAFHQRHPDLAALPFLNIEDFSALASNESSSSHRKALLFAAYEYERLATMTQAGDAGKTMRSRLIKKADWLRGNRQHVRVDSPEDSSR